MGTQTVILPTNIDSSSRRGRQAKRFHEQAWAHQQKREWAEAIDCYDAAMDAHAGAIFASLANRGMCYHMLGQPNEALRDYDLAWRAGNPRERELIRINRGVLLQAIGRYDFALADFESGNDDQSRLNAAYIHLARGNFEHGLVLYRSRPTVKQWRAPLHRLENLAGKRVLILHEQGYGDSIQMARFVPQIAAVAKSVHWITRRALEPMLAHNFPDVTLSYGDDVHAAAMIYKHDAFVMVMDLWQTCGLEIEGKPYLRAPFKFDDIWDRPIEGLSHARPNIGLAWRGRVDHENNRARSAEFDRWRPALAAASATYVSLQKDVRDDEREGLIDGGAPFDDFAGSAALLSCLDAVITVDTAVAHLAGALGIKTAILLPYAADWRWGTQGTTTPWYDSVRLFRQPAFDAWEPVIHDALAWCVEAKSLPPHSPAA